MPTVTDEKTAARRAAKAPASATAAEAKGKARKARAPMSDEHKAALAQGREERRIAARYFDALDAQGSNDAAKLDKLRKRAEAVAAKLDGEPDALARLKLSQEAIDLADAIDRAEKAAASAGDFEKAEADFVAILPSYAARHGYTRAAFRAVGVPLSVLKRAGL